MTLYIKQLMGIVGYMSDELESSGKIGTDRPKISLAAAMWRCWGHRDLKSVLHVKIKKR